MGVDGDQADCHRLPVDVGLQGGHRRRLAGLGHGRVAGGPAQAVGVADQHQVGSAGPLVCPLEQVGR
jgi:hypothetical protein